jgi:hypothetical protein
MVPVALIEMQDDTNIKLMHEPVFAWAGYVGGLFPTEHPLFLKYPHVPHVGICVNAEEDGDVLDMEAGDARPEQFPGWFRRQKARGVKRPKAYASKSDMPAVIAAANAAGINESEYDRWVASFDGRALLNCGLGEKAKQYTDHGYGRSLDLSVVDPSFFDGTTVPVVNKIDYSKFDKTKRRVLGKMRDETTQAQLYDRLRAMQTPKLHPRRAQLAFVRQVMKWFAKRLDEVAITNEPLKNGKPSWNVDNRGWRRKQFWARYQGARMA